jgi:hypothetical protein
MHQPLHQRPQFERDTCFEQRQQQKKVEAEVRAKKSQIDLNAMINLLGKDAEYITNYLLNKDWELNGASTTDDDISYISWSYNKNRYSEKAEAWFHLYKYDFGNMLTYQYHKKELYNEFLSKIKTMSFKKQEEEIVNGGLKTTYKNDNYVIILAQEKIKKDNYYDEGADVRYIISIFNYKQAEKWRKEAEEQQRLYEEYLAEQQRLHEEYLAEQQRIAKEAEEREQKYQNIVQKAENLYSRKQYESAKQLYIEAGVLKPDSFTYCQDKIKEIDIDILCDNAEELYSTNQYTEAKETYVKALLITPNAKTDYIKGKMREIDDFLTFLKERTYKVYNYRDIENRKYDVINSKIENNMRIFLLDEQILQKTDVHIIFEIDTIGNFKSNFTCSVKNKKLKKKLEEIIKNIKLDVAHINGYTAFAKAEFNYTISADKGKIKVKKNYAETYSNSNKSYIYLPVVKPMLYDAPWGTFKFKMNKATINNQDYINKELYSYNPRGGLSNMFLSMLIPGAGVRNVTGGEKSGIWRTIGTYLFIGGGIACKFGADSEYKLYHNATEQTSMDKHYDNANALNKSFYACASIGAIIWLYDIIWVAKRGIKNSKRNKAWKNSHLGLYYEPQFNATGLTYSFKF